MSPCVCSCLLGHSAREPASQTRLGEQEDGEQHVSDSVRHCRQHASPPPDLGFLLLVFFATSQASCG